MNMGPRPLANHEKQQLVGIGIAGDRHAMPPKNEDRGARQSIRDATGGTIVPHVVLFDFFGTVVLPLQNYPICGTIPYFASILCGIPIRFAKGSKLYKFWHSRTM
jgi:hypothetical protein